MHRYLLPTVVAIVWTAAPAVANDEQDCFQGMEPQLRIAGCSKLIRRNPNDAAVYHNRGVAYDLAGDIERATALLTGDPQIVRHESAEGLTPLHYAAAAGKAGSRRADGSRTRRAILYISCSAGFARPCRWEIPPTGSVYCRRCAPP